MKPDYKKPGTILIETKAVFQLAVLILLIMVTGCTGTQVNKSLEGKFTATTAANIGVFADNTMAMLSEANFGFSEGQALYTKPFFEMDAPEELAVTESARNAEVVLGLMLRYSLKLVSIVEHNPDDASQVKAYGAYLSSFDQKIRVAVEMNDQEYQAFITRLESQETFLGALQQTQPIINRMGRFMAATLTNLDDAIGGLVVKTDKRIDVAYAELIRYARILEKEKYAILAALEQVYLIAKEDKEAYARLLESKVVTDKSLLPQKTPNYTERQKILQYLGQRLDGLHRIGNEIEPEWKLYRATHTELDLLSKRAKQEIRQVRLMSLVWVRAHQKMAAGKTSPAEWFDINDAPGMLLQMGTKLIF
jgi:hypothetical protein